MKNKEILNRESIRYFWDLKITRDRMRIESGRSMVEILGVLAVIGVLSIGGIMGYRFAMDKYRANDIVNEVNIRSTDIWHRYQEIPLPDPSENGESDFPEFAEYTSTGFPVDVTSHPDVAFRVHVYDVPSGVCKQVLNMPLIGIIKGLQYIQVNDVKFEESNLICGENETDNEMVFTSFLDSDVGTDTHCLEDSECTSICGVPACDEETMRCTDGCMNNTDGKTKCLDEGGVGRCVECIENGDCEKGFICPETTHMCEKMQKTCPEGTFRTRNGACVACDDGSNFFVYMNGEPYPDSSDESDGYTMCQNCNPDRQYGESLEGNDIGYCSYMCTMGVSYQTANGQCVSCKDTATNRISNDTVSKEQCAACPDHEWYKGYGFLAGMTCQKKLECADDEFIVQSSLGYVCKKCSDPNMYYTCWETDSSVSNFCQHTLSLCVSCPEYDSDGKWAKRSLYGHWTNCYPTCEQPKSGSEADTICKDHPNDEKCTRKWQNYKGTCFACNANTGDSSLLRDGVVISQLKELCEACGRRVNDEGYCVPKEVSCGKNEFLAATGMCTSCSIKSLVRVESEEASGCSANCSDYSDSLMEGRIVSADSTYCMPKCKATNSKGEQLYVSSNGCTTCATTGNTRVQGYPTEVKESCLSCNTNGKIVRQVFGDYCEIASCPEVNGVKQWHQRYGECRSCNQTNPDYPHWDEPNNLSEEAKQHIQECLDCGTRIYFDPSMSRWNFYCVLVDPGVSGVCNSVETVLPSELNADLVSKSQPYLKGDYDGKKVRSLSGVCYDCTANISISTTRAQCNSCKNRRWENENCLKGLCEEGQQFLNANGTCVACSNKNVAINPAKENLCSSCANRRQLETGSSSAGNWAAKCVETCVGEQWQDINGNCLLCTEGGNREIGTDNESRNLCNKCENRQVVEKTDTDGNIIGYTCEEGG